MKIIPQANDEYNSVTYSCIRFTDSFRFLSSSLDSLVKTLVDNSHQTHIYSNKKLSIVMIN